MYKFMGNNVIVLKNLMRACTLHNVGHENNVNYLVIVGAMFAFNVEQDKMKYLVCKYIQLTISNMI